ncbi:mitochondrial ribosomal protein S15 [Mycena pura]|uniref:Mitochondrial ribosomal protein S15 n=1 Tax=Mycena pura TaxID=153505 RepID=A0AAD6VQ15_9AGAR|nr:mitochondrial ribosomal protein S15 [Mycena pura]
MLRACASQPCKLTNVASSSSRAFHTSTVVSKISEARLRSRVLKKANLEKREERQRQQQETRPSVILGTRPGEEHKWRDCYLARVLVDESVFSKPAQPLVRSQYGVEMPEYRAFGVDAAEEKKLFRDLPDLTHALFASQVTGFQGPPLPAPQPITGSQGLTDFQASPASQKVTAANFARVIDLRNSDAGGLGYENRRRIIKAFSAPENPFDTGRTEVQAAILTYRIRKLYAHLTRCKHDLQNKLSLRKLVHQRAKILRYLKRTQRIRYDALLEQLGVEPEAVEGELVVN